jgi:hypothetical protein
MKRLGIAALLATIGCASMEPVQVVLNPARLQGICRFIKSEEVYDPIGPKSLRAEIKDEVLKAGGDTVLIGPTESGFMTEHAVIEIYSCRATPQPSPTPNLPQS